MNETRQNVCGNLYLINTTLRLLKSCIHLSCIIALHSLLITRKFKCFYRHYLIDWLENQKSSYRSALSGHLIAMNGHSGATTAAYRKKQSFNLQGVGKTTGPDWALGMAKHAGTHSAAQWTTATFPHLICKAIPLPSHSAHSVHLFVISMSRLHLFCPLRRHEGEEETREGTRSQGGCSATKEHLHMRNPSQKQKKRKKIHMHPTHWANTHSPLPRLTNVPWHSYITRKLAKWINHGPCLALRALNGFSPLQVCPIIAFIHLVEARFTHSRRSCQSPDTFSALVARAWEICHWIITGNSNNN